MIPNLLRDLRFAGRTLLRSPGFTLVAVLSLGLGVGANTVTFSWADALVLRPFPLVGDAERLTRIQTRSSSGALGNASYADFLDWREQATSYSGMAAYSLYEFGLRGGAEGEPAERVWGLFASGDYFEVLGVSPLLGRTLLPSDERPGAAPVAVLGYGLWRRLYEEDPGIVGREITLNGQAVTVVGVAPQRFGGTVVGLNFDLWVPITTFPLLQPGSRSLETRATRWLDVVGRLAPGATIEGARAELTAIGERIAELDPAAAGRTPWAIPFAQDGGAQQALRPVLLMLFGMTALVLLIACANVANLLLARGLARRREMGIRIAVGAARWHLIRQLLIESFLLASGGAFMGLLVVIWGRNLLATFIPPSPFPILIDVTVSGRVLGLAALLTVVTTLLFGLLPALRASRVEVVGSIRGSDSGEPSGSRLRSGLVMGQVALAVVAITTSALFLRSLQQITRVDPGFRNPEQVLLASTNLRLAGHTGEAAHAVIAELRQELATLPGVASVAAASTVPLGFGGWNTWDIEPEGYQPRPDESLTLMSNAVGPGYFEAIGTAILQGRSIDERDRAGSADVVVINRAAADRYWPGQNPIGLRVRVGGRWLRVVGVAQDGKYNSLVDPTPPFLYLALHQWSYSEITFHLRAMAEPRTLITAARHAFARVDPGLPFLDPRTLQENMGAALVVQRLAASLMAAIGLLALTLAAIGIYGVLAYLVTRRTREIGIRVALGASRGAVLGMVVRDGARLAGSGLLVGVAAALGVATLLRGQLFGIQPADPLSFAGAVLLLATVALIAIYHPARRATRVQPMIAMRSD